MTAARTVRGMALLRWLGVLVLLLVLLELSLRLVYRASAGLQHLGGVPGFVIECVTVYLHVLLLGGVLVAVLEWKGHASGAPRRYGTALLFWAFYIPVAVAVTHAVRWIMEAWGVRPLLSLRLDDLGLQGWARTAANAGLVLVAAFLFDFFYYWFHRLQHASTLLWAFHSVHHANRSLNAIGCYHHPLEDVLRIPFFLLPMALAFDVDAPRLVLLSVFVTAWGLFNHADSRFSLGALRHLLADNHYHRVHHSLAPEHYDRNFAGMFAPWDRLFGTQHLPPLGIERMPVGLDDQPHPQTLRAYVGAPFGRIFGRSADAPAAAVDSTDARLGRP